MIHEIPPTHPRAKSLIIREKLVEGFRNGIVVPEGLIAHGRGEAFDYLLGEKTTKYAYEAEKVAVCLLLLSSKPVISVNGNTAALCAKDLVNLSNITKSKIEVNLFHKSLTRSKAIARMLKKEDANEVLGLDAKLRSTLRYISSNRKFVDKNGIMNSDTVFVALEDGDRTESLVKMGKKVISIDLNPLSRTAIASNVTIVDNIVRAMPNMIKISKQLVNRERSYLSQQIKNFDNMQNMHKSLITIRRGV
ncbi:MAG: 4-phosphopantoate--beta-alanine ligase [Nitrososphaeraceae archaeon]|jgi:4-phosphopantoate--beta-alanine ligase|nr:4-phosphopantoate--beta-alanine ligase [Nitrososphaeraceae archaeon]MDW0135909.1 4-phosphopantoate--beta-alanine ligase [Nitrososphaeraceae archaeon]MDW0155879.1 4-phosphopantoate--beta-alanine ligase [Nitrososphaeraceae archaeon]